MWCRTRKAQGRWRVLLAVAAALWMCAPVGSQTATLVKDINTQTATPADRFGGFVHIGWTGSAVLFNGRSDRAGIELWTSDGTAAGTTVMLDIYRGVWDSAPSRFTRIGSIVYFNADDGTNGTELWRTDGTPIGTWMVKDINPGDPSSYPNDLLEAAGRLFFTADDGTNGKELWVSDGTEAGTSMVKDIRPGSATSSPYYMAATSSGVMFRATDGVNGTELWGSDGTGPGTSLVLDIFPGSSSSSPSSLAVLSDVAYFSANDGSNGYELWRSDGTAGGTSMVKDIRSGSSSSPNGLEVFAGAVYFAANDGSSGSELWKSDGTTAGTTMVKDIQPGASGSYPSKLTATPSLLFLVADDGTAGNELWKSDGTTAGTTMVKDIRPGSWSSTIYQPTVTDFGIVFTASDGTNGLEPWKSDGTAAGTVIVDDINPGSGSSTFTRHDFMSTGAAVYFRADDGTTGDRLWVTDGSAAGTQGLTPLAVTNSASVGFFAACANGLLFMDANDGVNGSEPWISDATTAGTSLMLDVNPGAVSSSPYARHRYGSVLPFTAITASYGQELWTTDCTAAGTSLLKDVNPTGSSYPYSVVSAGGSLYFDGVDASGRELWVSDGTTAGTVMVTDINPGAGSSSPFAYPFGTRVLLRADDGSTGRELWISDGTAAGTSMVMDIAPGSAGSGPLDITDMGGFALFWADDGFAGQELWRTDGTGANTSMVTDINPGSGDARDGYNYYITPVSGVAYFAAVDGSNGSELWRSDGTPAGTWMVKDIYPGPTGSEPQAFVADGDRFFFVADDGVNGQELWRSDGTAAGTVLVRDVWPGATGSDAYQLKMVNGVLVLAAIGPDNGRELWVSDGTSAGTRLLAEVNPGPTGSSPFVGFQVGSDFLFSADDDEYGRELYRTCADLYYMDTDDDGHGDPDRPTLACTAPTGYVADGDDCDDGNDSTYPGATEACDAADNNCDGEIDDPSFAGLSSAAALSGGSCAIRLDWGSTTACDGTPVYNVYRSTTSGFDPGESTLQAACVPQTFWIDTAVTPGTTYYYVVRAENPSTGGFGPCHGGGEDNNTVERSASASSCAAAPQEVLYFSACSRDLEVQLEWVNPSASYGLTRACWKTGGFPTGPTDGVCVDVVGTAGTYGTTSHDTGSVGGISNGTLYHYAAFVNSAPDGSGAWSAGRFITGRPFDTSGAGKWGYSTSATALSSPGVRPGSASFSAANDRVLHASVAGGTGGMWPASWVPAAMNGPAQDRPIVIAFGTPTVGGASTVAFVGSHDGRAYAFNADTGVELWASPVLGDGIQASPSGILTAFGGAHDLILVGTRTPAGDSELHGLELADGTVAWTFDNGGGSNGFGIISSQAWVDADNLRVYFTSRQKSGGSGDTVWCVAFADTTATRLWSRDLGDVDSAPTVRAGAVYVGTNTGSVYALDPATGLDLWSAPYASGDGAVRGYVWFDDVGGGRRLYFSTASSVHGLTDNGASSSTLWTPVSLANPSPVIVVDDDLYVGSSAGNGSLVRLDKVTGSQLGSITLGDPAVAKHVGSPSYDWVSGQVVVGTEQGVVYAVDDGF